MNLVCVRASFPSAGMKVLLGSRPFLWNSVRHTTLNPLVEMQQTSEQSV